MWIKLFSLISLILVTTNALPTRILDKTNQNAIISMKADESATDDHILGMAEFRRPITQNKPRILVSYGNVYKQTPTDPVQNLLMYFLMNVARDFAQEQDQFERRRSPNFFSDAKSAIAEVSGKIINSSKKTSQKISDSFKTITSRDSPLQPQYEESHYYPHIDGTCMCFNRLIRHGSIEDRISDNLINDAVKENVEVSSEKEKKSSDVMDKLLSTDKAIELKTENHNVLSTKEKTTIVRAESEPITKENSAVRVLKVMDLENLDTSKPVRETSTEPKPEFERKAGDDLAVEFKAIHQADLNQGLSQETYRQPDISQSITNEIPIAKKDKLSEGDGYYFLSVSGGTDKRTTASETKHRELNTLHHYENLLPRYEDKLPHLKEAKRKRRRFKRHHGHQKSNKNVKRQRKFKDRLKKKLRKRAKRHTPRKNDFLLFNGDSLVDGSNLISGVPDFVLANSLIDDRWKDAKYRIEDSEPPTQQTMFLTITLPTFLGGGIFLLGLCYFLRGKGWCCRLFMDKSNIVVVDVKDEKKTEETTQ